MAAERPYVSFYTGFTTKIKNVRVVLPVNLKWLQVLNVISLSSLDYSHLGLTLASLHIIIVYHYHINVLMFEVKLDVQISLIYIIYIIIYLIFHKSHLKSSFCKSRISVSHVRPFS